MGGSTLRQLSCRPTASTQADGSSFQWHWMTITHPSQTRATLDGNRYARHANIDGGRPMMGAQVAALA